MDWYIPTDLYIERTIQEVLGRLKQDRLYRSAFFDKDGVFEARLVQVMHYLAKQAIAENESEINGNLLNAKLRREVKDAIQSAFDELWEVDRNASPARTLHADMRVGMTFLSAIESSMLQLKMFAHWRAFFWFRTYGFRALEEAGKMIGSSGCTKEIAENIIEEKLLQMLVDKGCSFEKKLTGDCIAEIKKWLPSSRRYIELWMLQIGKIIKNDDPRLVGLVSIQTGYLIARWGCKLDEPLPAKYVETIDEFMAYLVARYQIEKEIVDQYANIGLTVEFEDISLETFREYLKIRTEGGVSKHEAPRRPDDYDQIMGMLRLLPS